MDKYANNQILRDIITKRKWRHRDVVELLASKYGSVSQKAVEAWIYDKSPLSGPMIELIQIKVNALTQQQPG